MWSEIVCQKNFEVDKWEEFILKCSNNYTWNYTFIKKKSYTEQSRMYTQVSSLILFLIYLIYFLWWILLQNLQMRYVIYGIWKRIRNSIQNFHLCFDHGQKFVNKIPEKEFKIRDFIFSLRNAPYVLKKTPHTVYSQ